MKSNRRHFSLALSVPILVLAFGCSSVGSKDGRAAGTGRAAGSTPEQEQPMKMIVSKSQYDITPLTRDQVATLAAKLDPEAYRVTQKSGTEPAFCGNLVDNKKDGIYCCVVCGLPLFSSEHKFDSKTGWPSFWREFDSQHVTQETDSTQGMVRTEIRCARCGAHLGHVFEDGPAPTGQRYCLNSAALVFREKGAALPPESRPLPTQVAYFAGGCFWGLEHYFQKGPGVVDAISGYMQGRTANPTYQEVCTETTGYAETVKVIFDPQRISYRRLLEAFFVMHDPTQLDRQGPDVGDQYRSGIWYVNELQRQEAEGYIRELQSSDRYRGRRIVTKVEPAKEFWPAEDYHQDYVQKTGRACSVTNPW